MMMSRSICTAVEQRYASTGGLALFRGPLLPFWMKDCNEFPYTASPPVNSCTAEGMSL